MSQNKLNQVYSQANKTILVFKNSQYSDAIQSAKKVIEQICSQLLRNAGIAPEEYSEKHNAHREWGLEKLIKECEIKDLLDSSLCVELYLIKDWRNNLEHANDELLIKSFASQSLEVVRKLYFKAVELLGVSPITHWPDNLQSGFGGMLPFSPQGISAEDGQLVIQGPDGQRVCLDFLNDGASWVDENGNKKYYKGNISERNNAKGWIG